MKIPKITSDWRVLFTPEKTGNYVNDHCIIKDNTGKWNLYGITGFDDNPHHERYFVYATGDSLDQPMKERGKVIDNGLRAWAPCVVENEGLYYMYYGPGETRMEVTHDPTHWMGHTIHITGNPVMSVNRDHMVIRVRDTWLMYASGVKDGCSCISLLTSTDLINWTFYGYALTSSPSAPLNPPWGAFESPFVLPYDDRYYLFTTYTDSHNENYMNTLVFCSDTPYYFGNYTAETHDKLVVTTLEEHAGEIICDQGHYYITTCGWRKKPIPNAGSVSIADLEFI